VNADDKFLLSSAAFGRNAAKAEQQDFAREVGTENRFSQKWIHPANDASM
jgi:hypothetical protein